MLRQARVLLLRRIDRDLGLAVVDRLGDEAVDLPLIDQLDRAAGIGALGEDHRHQFRTMLLESADQGRSEEHTSELQSLMRISYAVFRLIKNMIILLITLSLQ